MNKSSVLPDNLAKLTNKPLDSVNFSTDDIPKILNNLDPNKAQGHNMLSIRMITLCGNSICKPLLVIFNDCLMDGNFHKKGDKQCLNNYTLISFLPNLQQ